MLDYGTVTGDDGYVFGYSRHFLETPAPQLPVLAERDEGNGAPAIIGMLDYRDMMQAYGRELARRRES